MLYSGKTPVGSNIVLNILVGSVKTVGPEFYHISGGNIFTLLYGYKEFDAAMNFCREIFYPEIQKI